MRHKSQRISGSFLGLVLAMALLGPAPAVAIGVASTLIDQLRTRLPPAQLITNLATYATFPLIGALVIERLAASTDLETNDLTFALVVFGAFMVANCLNFAMIAGDYAFHHGVSMSRQLRTIFVPVLPSALVGALLTVSVAVLYREVGLAALALFALVLVVFQYLLRALLLSQRRAEELAALQLGVLTSLVETLALRDRMTARHSAAVARYARALALANGGSKEQQELAHTAGLLHDIGKFSFPDAILHAQQPARRGAVEDRAPPPRGGRARVVRRMEGYGPVAEIILCHHERWDGNGYPRGVAGEEIPLVSRMISIADAYDVMTARDSYRRPRRPPRGDRRAAARGRPPVRSRARRGLRRAAGEQGPGLPPRRRRRLRDRARLRAARARVRPPRPHLRVRHHPALNLSARASDAVPQARSKGGHIMGFKY